MKHHDQADETPADGQQHHTQVAVKSAPLKSSQSTFVTSVDNSVGAAVADTHQSNRPVGADKSNGLIKNDDGGATGAAAVMTPTDKRPKILNQRSGMDDREKVLQTAAGTTNTGGKGVGNGVLVEQQSTSDSYSLCNSDQMNIVKEHMNFIVGLLISPDFKQVINWANLRRETLAIEEQAMESSSGLRNFIILSALKI